MRENQNQTIDDPDCFNDHEADELSRLLKRQCLEAVIEDGDIVIKAIIGSVVMPVAKIDFLNLIRGTSEEIRHGGDFDDLVALSDLTYQAFTELQRDISRNEKPGAYSVAMVEPTDMDMLTDDEE